MGQTSPAAPGAPGSARRPSHRPDQLRGRCGGQRGCRAVTLRADCRRAAREAGEAGPHCATKESMHAGHRCGQHRLVQRAGSDPWRRRQQPRFRVPPPILREPPRARLRPPDHRLRRQRHHLEQGRPPRRSPRPPRRHHRGQPRLLPPHRRQRPHGGLRRSRCRPQLSPPHLPRPLRQQPPRFLRRLPRPRQPRPRPPLCRRLLRNGPPALQPPLVGVAVAIEATTDAVPRRPEGSGGRGAGRARPVTRGSAGPRRRGAGSAQPEPRGAGSRGMEPAAVRVSCT